MRQIKFRGMRINNVSKEMEWVYGSYFKGNENTYILQKKAPCEKDNQGLNPFKPLQIIPETIGQFTGLQDKNLKDMYECDILDSDGIIIGDIHNNYGLQKEESNIVIPQITSKNWVSAYKKALERGCRHSK